MSESKSMEIKVVDQQGVEVVFRVKKDTKIRRIQEAYAQQKGVELGSVRFVYDGNRLRNEDDHTPKTLEMEDGDQLDAM